MPPVPSLIKYMSHSSSDCPKEGKSYNRCQLSSISTSTRFHTQPESFSLPRNPLSVCVASQWETELPLTAQHITAHHRPVLQEAGRGAEWSLHHQHGFCHILISRHSGTIIAVVLPPYLGCAIALSLMHTQMPFTIMQWCVHDYAWLIAWIHHHCSPTSSYCVTSGCHTG